MSDIQLNIGGYSSDSDNQSNFVSKKPVAGGKKSKTGQQINDFAFEFTKKSKVKAFVARKRNTGPVIGDGPPKISTANESPPPPNSVNTKMIARKRASIKFGQDALKPVPMKPVNRKSSSAVRDSIVGSGKADGLDAKKVVLKVKQSLNDTVKVPEVTKLAGGSPTKRDTSFIVNNIFNPERQRRIEALKQTINNNEVVDKPQTHTYREDPERQKHRKAMQKQQKEPPLLGQRFVKPVMEKVFSGVPLQSLNFHAHAVKNLKDIFGISELTSIQQKAIPKIHEGHDILVRAQTGSGKTLAYALPIVEKMHNIRPKLTRNSGIQALVVVPTRELAIQSYDVFIKLLKPFTWIVPGYLSGGEKRKSEKARLRKGINILVGTPGRLLDHLLNTESLNFDKMKWLVLDEADRLFELGYEKDVSKIIEALHKKVNAAKLDPITEDDDSEEPLTNKITFKDDDEISALPDKKIQSILLSATLTSAVEKLAGLTLTNPLFIDNAEKDTVENKNAFENFEEAAESLVIPSTAVLSYFIVPPKLRFITLAGLLVKECNKTSKKILVFVATQDLVDFHHDTMTELLTKNILDEDDESDDADDDKEEDAPEVVGVLKGVRFFRLHGLMSQVERSSIFKAFCATKSGILLTTDVAARGLDVPEVDLVVQYTPPQLLSDFVHRVGRTARAGRKGRSIVFLSTNETEYIRILEDKRIRISQIKYQPFLDILLEVSDEAKNVQDAIYHLQRRYESMVAEDEEIHEKAGKAFASWVRYYSAFPKELKHIFNIRIAHMGHYAKSFGLKEPPTSIVKHHNAPKVQPPSNRLSYRNTEDDKKGKKRKYNVNAPHAPKKQNAKTICLTTSEFDSGMPSKKRKTKN